MRQLVNFSIVYKIQCNNTIHSVQSMKCEIFQVVIAISIGLYKGQFVKSNQDQ